jgi:hypothetical protein
LIYHSECEANCLVQEMFVGTNWGSSSRNSKKDTQYHDQQKKDTQYHDQKKDTQYHDQNKNVK